MAEDREIEDFRAKQIREFLDSSSFISKDELPEESGLDVISSITNIIKKATDDLPAPIPRRIIEQYSPEMDALILECFFRHNDSSSIIRDQESHARLQNITTCVYES